MGQGRVVSPHPGACSELSGPTELRLLPAVLQEPRWMTKLSTSAKPRTSMGKSKRRSSSWSPDTVCFYVLSLVYRSRLYQHRLCRQ